ncbi:AAA family ATPase [Rhizobium sp. KVB221]|uniref:AAA family ATPase n=1 Tax=Rhizobium setariae TaxID=2801340 RepID=A0A936YMP6_9HYPH|nr:AAA family ATPase [Rhizobium setariae]MBL0371051.1 AAA family ATPase [Rhizobium setariae]
MPVITIANTKGGAGKTTAAALLAVELAHCGYKVTVFDSDPQHWFSQWYETARPTGAITLVNHVTPASLECHIREMDRATDFFIIDLAGDRNQLTATALALSNQVLIPVQGSGMDAKGAVKILDLIDQIRTETGYEIPHSVLLSRVNPLVTTHSLLAVKGLLASRGVNVLATPVIERAAYREMFDKGVTLYELDPQKISNLDKAQNNARELAAEIMRMMPVRVISSGSSRRRAFGWGRAA